MTSVLPEVDADRPPPSPRAVRPALLVAAGVSLAVLAVLVAVAFTRSGGGGGDDPPGGDQRLVGQSLPALPFERFDGTPASLSDLDGPLVINFFAYWCAPCREEMPAFQQVHERFGDQVTVFGLDYVDQLESGRRMVEETGITYDVGRDPQGTVMEGIGGAVMPTTVLVDDAGTVVAVHGGRIDEAGLEDLLVEHGLIAAPAP